MTAHALNTYEPFGEELRGILHHDGWRVGATVMAVVVTALVPSKGVWPLLPGGGVALVAGFPILRQAAESLVAKRMTMELSMSIAIGAALAIGEVSTALLILLFVMVAEILEELNLSRGRRAMTDLAALLPQKAWIERDASAAPVERLADRLAGWIVAVALFAAIATALVTHDARAAVSVVIVAGACGVAAGTPLAILGAIGQAARRHVIVKGGALIEVLAAVDTVVFDKTGTVTLGQPTVTHIAAKGASVTELLIAAATAEQHSDHPLAKAIVAEAARRGVEPEALDGSATTDGGVIGTTRARSIVVAGSRTLFDEMMIHVPPLDESNAHGTEVLVARDGICLGALRIEDALRQASRQAIDALRRMNIRTILLTGDAASVARPIANWIGVDEVDAEFLPFQKQRRIQWLRGQGHTVAMVGDGINDAPALVEANVGIAMGSGTDVTCESANVVLLGNEPTRVPEVIAIARRCRRIVMQNFAATIAIDLIGLILAATRVLHPVSAAVVHVTAELLFILNAARMLPRSR